MRKGGNGSPEYFEGELFHEYAMRASERSIRSTAARIRGGGQQWRTKKKEGWKKTTTRKRNKFESYARPVCVGERQRLCQ